MQLLPRSLGAAEAVSLVAQLLELDAVGPKALLIVDSAGAEQLKAGLERIDPDWKIPAVILEIPAGLLTVTDPNAILTYLLELLARADSLPGRQSAGLEATLTLQAKRQALFISTGT